MAGKYPLHPERDPMKFDKRSIGWIAKMQAKSESLHINKFGNGPYGLMRESHEQKELIAVGFDTCEEAESFGVFIKIHDSNVVPSEMPDNPGIREMLQRQIEASHECAREHTRYIPIIIQTAVVTKSLPKFTDSKSSLPKFKLTDKVTEDNI